MANASWWTPPTRATGDWSGQWSGTLSGDSPLVGGEFVYQTAGLLAFEIFCEDDKLLIRGGLDGIAENLYPFESMLAGEYDAESGRVVMQMVEGVVHINFQGIMIDVQFEGTLQGEVVGERIDAGTWEGRSTLPEGAEGDGVWQAAKQP